MASSSLFVASGELPWRKTPYAGVQWKKLRFHGESGESAVLLRFQPGACYADHRHPDGEHYWILEGSLQDGGQDYGPGTYVHHPPGSSHHPSSRQGCLLLVLLPTPIELLTV